MNSYNKIYRYCISLVVLPLLLALMGCEDIIFDKDADCPTPTDKRIVRITATVLAPAGGGSSTRSAMSNTLRAANPFEPNKEQGSNFENQIATLRVIGFYTEDQGEKNEGDVTFNKIFADSDILNKLGWTIKDGVETLIKHPVGSNVSLEFETDVAGEFGIVLIANESLAAAATLLDGSELEVMTLSDNGKEPSANIGDYQYDLKNVKNIGDLKKAFLTNIYEFLYNASGNDGKKNFNNWESTYRGALPKEVLIKSNGGIPMVGQGKITLSRNTPSSTGFNSVTSADINLERVMAKLELNISNTYIDENKDEQYDSSLFEGGLHISSIRLNNYPMYAMLLPSKRDETDWDYATQGTEHIYYSYPTSPFMDMYRAEEKTIKSSDGWNIIPITPKAYNSDGQLKAVEENFFKPSYMLYPYYAVGNDNIFWYNWVYYCMPGVVIYKDGSVRFPNGVVRPDEVDRGIKPLEVYMLPTTNEIMPDKMAYGTVEPGNGIADMKHAPTEVIVRIGRYKGNDANLIIGNDQSIMEMVSKLMNNDEAIADHHFLLFNQEANKTNDKYAIRRNTIYRMNLTWEGKKLYLAYPDGTKVLPWKVEKETIEVEI